MLSVLLDENANLGLTEEHILGLRDILTPLSIKMPGEENVD